MSSRGFQDEKPRDLKIMIKSLKCNESIIWTTSHVNYVPVAFALFILKAGCLISNQRLGRIRIPNRKSVVARSCCQPTAAARAARSRPASPALGSRVSASRRAATGSCSPRRPAMTGTPSSGMAAARSVRSRPASPVWAHQVPAQPPAGMAPSGPGRPATTAIC